MKLFWAISVSLLLSFNISNGDQTKPKTFIISVQNDRVPPNFATLEDWYKSILTGISPSSTLLYSYTAAFHGFAARLTAAQAQRLQTTPPVLRVFEDRLLELHTTRTPLFLGLNVNDTSGHSKFNNSDGGSSVVIGLLDTGIWPESRSFSDHDLPPVPPNWKGVCEGGADFPKSLCNRKLVGVRFFDSGIQAMFEGNFVGSARDDVGHGTHTASTAAGSAVENASFFGLAAGVATGIAPKARIAVYRVCYGYGCAASDILAGMDTAIADGVDILSLSLGIPSPTKYIDDPIAIGAFSAVEKGIFVSTSAGNSGPTPAAVINTAPWLSTIGAGSIDRGFPADVVLKTGEVITGVSLYNGKPHETKFYPLIYNNEYCNTAAIPKVSSDKVKGKIVVCEAVNGPFVARLLTQKGGAGVVAVNRAEYGEGLLANPYETPGLDIPYSQTKKLLSYINSTGAPMGKMRFHGTVVGVKPAPMVAFFSSRGPDPITRFVLKPDVIAPGLNILAAWPYNVSLGLGDTRITEFNIISGTSMSCPHVSGIAALLKAAHLMWSPAMIRSALITTAYLKDRDFKPLKDQFSYKDATIWDTGAGHVDPARANDPGLVYDVKIEEYIDYLCASNYSEGEIKVITSKRNVSCSGRTSKPWDLNYPAIVVDSDGASAVDVVVKRAVMNVGNTTLPVKYKAEVKNPRGTTVTVDPPELTFSSEDETQRFEVRIKGEKNGSSWFEVGGLIWSDGNHNVSSPIVVQWGNPVQY